MKNDCLFCAIIAEEIPGTKVYEDELCYAFRDINPQAPNHILVVPKEHIASLAELNEQNASVAAHCLLACGRIAEQGKHAELVEKRGIYWTLEQSQLGLVASN